MPLAMVGMVGTYHNGSKCWLLHALTLLQAEAIPLDNIVEAERSHDGSIFDRLLQL